jgi:large subunit ribosomal protein L35
MGKNKNHKGILKRMKLTKTGLVRHNRAFGKHLRSHKSGKRLRRLRQDKFLSNPEAKRLERMLYRRLRGRDQSRAELRRSPSPQQRRDAQAQKLASASAPAPTTGAARRAAARAASRATAPAALRTARAAAPAAPRGMSK